MPLQLSDTVMTKCIIEALYCKTRKIGIERTKKEVLLFARTNYGDQLRLLGLCDLHILKELKELCSLGWLVFYEGRYRLDPDVLAYFNGVMRGDPGAYPTYSLRSLPGGIRHAATRQRMHREARRDYIALSRVEVEMGCLAILTALSEVNRAISDVFAIFTAIALSNMAAAMVSLAEGDLKYGVVVWELFLP